MGLKEGLGNAGKGAAIGSIAGPWGTAIGGGIGLISGLFDSSTEDADAAAAKAQADKIEALRQAGVKIDQYRPQLMQMEQAGKQEQLGQYQGASNLLAAMQGQGQAPVGQYNNPVIANADRGINPAMLRASSAPGAGGTLSGAKPQQGFGPQTPISPLQMRRG